MKVKTQKIICNALMVLLIAIAIMCFVFALSGEGEFTNWVCLAALVCMFVVPLDFWLERLKNVHERGSN